MASPFHDELVARATLIDGHADVLGMLVDAGVLRRAAAALAEPFASDGIAKVAEECGGEYAGLAMLVDQLPAEMRDELAPVFAVTDAAEFR